MAPPSSTTPTTRVPARCKRRSRCFSSRPGAPSKWRCSATCWSWASGRLARARMGQQIREEGPVAHHGKAGTPTAGGVVFILVALVLYLAADRSLAGGFVLIALVLGGALGFIDDFSAIRGGRNLGLRARQKIVIQLATGALLGYLALRWGLTTQLVPFDGRQPIGA